MRDSRTTRATILARLLEQTARALHSASFKEGLYPAQWSALRYFARAQSPHRTAAALARFQGLAAGPVTRTVRTLAAKGYLQSDSSGRRGRETAITAAGLEMLALDPLVPIASAIEDLPEAEATALASALELILRRLQDRSDTTSFTSPAADVESLPPKRPRRKA
jgi:DNA-binding MarR family transcriptional regulator